MNLKELEQANRLIQDVEILERRQLNDTKI